VGSKVMQVFSARDVSASWSAVYRHDIFAAVSARLRSRRQRGGRSNEAARVHHTRRRCGGFAVRGQCTTAPIIFGIDEAMRGAVARKEIAGVVVMAADRKGIIYQGAFGVADIAEARPLKLDALFRIASMTKAVTSTAAMQLVETGPFRDRRPGRKISA